MINDAAGFALLPRVFESEDVERLRAIAPFAGGRRGGVRNLLAVPGFAELALSPAMMRLVEPVLGPDAVAVRGLFFDKTPEANWKLPWHQDLMIAVDRRVEGMAGWGAASVKDGVPHVEPPVAVLERMLAARIHLDDCGADNGPLRVIPGSHAHGRLTPEAIERWRCEVPEVVCTAAAGDVLLMRPLLLHASSAAHAPAHRRVIHIEYASAEPLPGGIGWWAGSAAAAKIE